MDVPQSETTERAGVALTELAVSRDLGWLFREQLESDRGVDAHIEVVLDGRSTGRLVGLQIKTGASYFGERADDGFVYRPDSRHVEYWLAHSLPVIVVLVDLGAMCAFWQVVGRETLVPTGRNWKIVVPFSRKLTADNRATLAELADATPYTLRLRQYQLARRWMQLLFDGGELVLTMEEWINKSSGRASIELLAKGPDGRELGERSWPALMLPFPDYTVELLNLFPWADLQVDDAYYHYDYEFASYRSWSLDESNNEEEKPGIGPYADDGEIAYWRLKLTLNDVGRAFLLLDHRLEEGLIPLA